MQLPDAASFVALTPASTDLDNQLVRIRMMVRETLEPETFVGALREGGTWRTSKYNDTLEYGATCEEAYWQRVPVHVTPLAGRSVWCQSSDPSCPPGATPL